MITPMFFYLCSHTKTTTNISQMLITITTTWLFVIVITKFNQGSTTYIKTIYSFFFVTGLGLLLIYTNINFVLPIYYMLELGTVMFMLILLKSNTGFFTEIEETAMQVKPVFVYLAIPIFFETVTSVFNLKNTTQTDCDTFVDYFKKNKYLNEFYPFVIELITYKKCLFVGLLAFVVAATGVIIFIKQTSLVPSRSHLWWRDVDVFQKIPNFFYTKHKNILTQFRPT